MGQTTATRTSAAERTAERAGAPRESSRPVGRDGDLLQRTAGNRVTTALLQPGTVIQRACACAQGLDTGARCDACHRAPARPLLQRAPTVGWKGSGAKSLNAGPTKVGAIRRIPLDGLGEGNQDPDQPRGKESAQGRAIVLVPDTLDPTQSAQVLLHFHGWNLGYRESRGQYRDRDIDRIEQQVEASPSGQLIGVLPQGTTRSWFGKTGKEKSFDTDAYLTEVFTALATAGIWSKAPSVGSVVISGHSGAGELINEKLLGGAATSRLPSQVGTLKEVALFDAVNGPNELKALRGWLGHRLDVDLAKLKTFSAEADKLAYVKSSVRFRAYFSHTDGDAYVPRHVGPGSVQDLIDTWFRDHDADLGTAGSTVARALRGNYRVIDVGHKDHEEIMSRGDRLKDALSVLPSREPGAVGDGAPAPPEVYTALRTPGTLLDVGTRAWAERRFDQDFSHVRIHTDGTAGRSARAVQALAYTVGRDIVFGPGQYAPHQPGGRRLLAHELTHVVQQRGASTPPSAGLTVGAARDALEAQADRQADGAAPAAAESTASAPTVQRAPDDDLPLKRGMCETTSKPPEATPGQCLYKFPENCPTYETWIQTFTDLKTFEARATPTPQTGGGHVTRPHVFDVIGGEAAPRKPQKGEEAKAAPPPTGTLRTGEGFIDHPTDTWVKTCLPANLRATAYQLPSDCADIAVILRHVWLAAHKRTETFGTWTIGDAAGHAAAGRVATVIKEVFTGNVARMVNPYTDVSGRPLVAFEDLEPLLHPGDVLVWAHHDHGFDKPRTGGHTLTITGLGRDTSGKIQTLSALQGNEPIFGDPEDAADDDKAAIIKALKRKDTKALREELGHAPGRRIETITLKRDADLQDSDPDVDKTKQKTWKWGATTILVAAGPPRAAKRPPMKKVGGQTVRALADWLPALKAASQASLPGVLEAALLEARAMIEHGENVSDDDMRMLGQAAGDRVWALARKAGGLANESHFQVLGELRRMIQAYRASARMPVGQKKPLDPSSIPVRLVRQFGLTDDAFNVAARGGADIHFGEAPRNAELVKVLVTGFDPFDPTGSLAPPDPGAWNPSGAAALALDDQRITVSVAKGVKAVADVQGVVLPVSYTDFKSDLVERIVKPVASEVDAVITASVDPGLSPDAPVRLERYAVGVHTLGGGEAIPAAAGGGLGPAIIEAPAPLEQISAAAADTKSKVLAPTIGEDITFRFAKTDGARGAREALGKASSNPTATLAAIRQDGPELVITDHEAIVTITKTMKRGSDGRQIGFAAGGQTFLATVLSGPGGNFLSNEISYRILRLLAETKSAKNPVSFHVHTQAGNVIPPAGATKAEAAQRKAAIKAGGAIVDKLVATLRRLITAVTKVIVDRRSSGGSGKTR